MNPNPTATAVPAKWEENPLEWPRAAGQVDLLMTAIAVRQKRQRRRRVAAGAAVLTTACLCFLASIRTGNFDAAPLPEGRALVVAPQRLVLPDGSVAELNQGAQLTIDFSASSSGARTVSLTNGEAHFQVAKFSERPFVVRVAGVNFRAVGTAFSVGLSGSSIEMLVTEGRVAVETREGISDSPKVAAVVNAGNRVVVDSSATQNLAVSPVSAVVSQQKLAWRIPRLEFSETPLSEVVGLLNQHSGKRISLATAVLGSLQISGALRADNLEPLLQILETTHRIKANRGLNDEIVLMLER